MAVVDLADLVADMETELSVPGTATWGAATEEQWVAHLRNAFWEAVLDGIIVGYTENEGLVSPKSGDGTLPRELQQVIIYYGGIRIIRNKLLDLKTKFKTSAGTVAYETEQSANVLKGLLDELVRRRNIWLQRLSDMGTTDSQYVDAVVMRHEGYLSGDLQWW